MTIRSLKSTRVLCAAIALLLAPAAMANTLNQNVSRFRV